MWLHFGFVIFWKKEIGPEFQRTLLVEIRTLVSWLKSTLFLKKECPDTHIDMKTNCLETKCDAALFRGKGKDRVAL